MKKIFLTILFTLTVMILIPACSPHKAEVHRTSRRGSAPAPEFEYAKELSISGTEEGAYEVSIADGRRYVLVPSGVKVDEKGCQGFTIIDIPAKNIYLAASSIMDMMRQLEVLDDVVLTSTTDWAIDGIKERLDSQDMYFIGRYSSPDYEALLESDCSLAIESTMIYHSPKVCEQIESLGIPVLIDRSSYEQDPLGRLEWIKLYGLIMGKEEEAEAFFQSEKKLLDEAGDKLSAEGKNGPKTAFFSVSSQGYITARRPGDYITKMIEMAGGRYVPDDVPGDDSSATSTINIQSEAFVETACDADILIYNSAIRGRISSIDELLQKSDIFDSFKAVKSGNVWCTKKSVYQETTGMIKMIVELSDIISGNYDESKMNYFYKIK